MTGNSKNLFRATATPLASIFGSGFLVIVPILYGAVGPYSLVAMGCASFQPLTSLERLWSVKVRSHHGAAGKQKAHHDEKSHTALQTSRPGSASFFPAKCLPAHATLPLCNHLLSSVTPSVKCCIYACRLQ